MSLKKLSVLLPTLVLVFVFFTNNAGASELPINLPGSVNAISNHFEITNSEYLNISLDSSATIKARIESIPQIITMIVNLTLMRQQRT